MLFRNRLQYFLVRHLKISNNEAQNIILSGEIKINEKNTTLNLEIKETDQISYQNSILQESKKLIYIAFYKPIGIETTLNPNISDNLLEYLSFNERVFPVGRLDKASEGLLLLTNDGKIFDKTLRVENNIEKEYLVKVDKPIDHNFIEQMAEGIVIMGKKTKKAFLKKINEFEFEIILTQGLNRQIRRMCYQLGYSVINLKRIRIGNLKLENLQPGEWRFIDKLKN